MILFADDLGYGDIGCYNPDSKIPTPHIDGLAADGMRFVNAYSAAAVCVPSRHALMTGRYPFRDSPLRWGTHPTIPAGTTTVAALLRGQGYRTACVGKWHCGFDGGVADQSRDLTGGPVDRGFDSFFGQHGSLDQSPCFYIRDRRAVQPATLPIAESHEEGHSIANQGRVWRAGQIAADFKHEEAMERYTSEAIDVLRSRKGSNQPLFLYFAMTAPHAPWLPDEKFRGKSRAGTMGDFVVQVDDIVGRVLQTLDDIGHRDDTLVLLSSDNGPLWFDGDVAKWGHDSAGGLRGRKGDIWDGGIRMPLIARWPGRITKGTISQEVVGLVDLLATLAAIAGVKLPDDAIVDSHDFSSVLFGEKRDQPIREAILLESGGASDLAIRMGPWKYIPWLGSGGFLTKPARIDPATGDPPAQLYNLDSDPGEMKNLYAEHPEMAGKLSKLLQGMRASSRTRP